jgi:hypothetical protein
MTDDRASPPKGSSQPPPRCADCKEPMRLLMAIPRVSGPGRVCLFECAKCADNLTFRSE